MALHGRWLSGEAMRIGLISPERRYAETAPASADALFEASGGNLGNFAFIEALWRHLSPDVVLLPWFVSPQVARESCDIIVFAAANQLGAHNDLGDFATHLENIDLPLVAVGLGAQAESLDAAVELPAGTVRWVRTLARLAPGRGPNLGVRGEFTLRVLEKLGLAERAVVTGCPSNFLGDRPDLFATLARFAGKPERGAALRRGRQPALQVRHATSSRGWPYYVAATQGAYVVQADLDMVRFARGEERVQQRGRRGSWSTISLLRGCRRRPWRCGGGVTPCASTMRCPGWKRCALTISASARGFTASCSPFRPERPAA